VPINAREDKENVAHIHRRVLVIKNKIVSFAGKWLELELIMVSKISWFHKDKYHMFSLIYGS
jgi:hypothetical protein